ncbi:hypothetical protein E3N88_07440 [Mikania micrantha]|uniref:Uncharacterized protein n=1 Tax=Mikania micrantha TaxID=192012 RepID=A0A5N6PRK0_9ASTR|nr:hypothetical protein E3N88_07440 [Mikania micrantha]
MADDNTHSTPQSLISKDSSKKDNSAGRDVEDMIRSGIMAGNVSLSRFSYSNRFGPVLNVGLPGVDQSQPIAAVNSRPTDKDFQSRGEGCRPNTETLKAQLAELEHKEKLDKLKAQLSYNEEEPEGATNEPRYNEELWEKILKMLEGQKMPRTHVEENDDPKKNEGEPEEEEDPLLRPYHPTNYTDLSKFTRRIGKALLPKKLKLPANGWQADEREHGQPPIRCLETYGRSLPSGQRPDKQERNLRERQGEKDINSNVKEGNGIQYTPTTKKAEN